MTKKAIIERAIRDAYYATCFSSDYDSNVELIIETLNKRVNLDSLEEVVHCKDCKYTHVTMDGKRECDIWSVDEEKVYVSGKFFCAGGVKK